MERQRVDRRESVGFALEQHPGLAAWLAQSDVRDELRLAALMELVDLPESRLVDPALSRRELLELPLREPYAALGPRLALAYDNALPFGTAGLRERMGPGFGRMNHYTVARAADAIAQWLLGNVGEQVAKGRPVVIGYDTRHHARDYAEAAAVQLARHGVQVELFDDWCATPLVAYAIRPRAALCALMLTASHNDASYNGMKLYGEDGIQADEHAAAVIAMRMRGIERRAGEDLDALREAA